MSDKSYYLLIYFIVFSFIGWVMESCLCSYNEKKLVNRGFMTLPFCPIYGFGMCFITIIFYVINPENLAMAFVVGLVTATSLEYFTSYILEVMFHLTWWDYKQKRFNLNGRIALDISIYWGLLSVFMTSVFLPFLNVYIDKVNFKVGSVIIAVVLLSMVLDTGVTVYHLLNFNKIIAEIDMIKLQITEKINEKVSMQAIENFNDKLNEKFNKKISEKFNIKMAKEIKISSRKKIDELKGKINSIKISSTQERIIKAFPNLQHTRSRVTFGELRRKVKKIVNRN